ncbi:uncharacterized protein N7459_002587 [Penicillium hispanicum]|uniref:uncharacterized protein n=1 Tax=Penicillium hispanicum TaxID=1080232 RepID=UPI00254199AD|nr:uncharacterized protein N7459_002587 [Penicillium hispanicum]KAJ5586822.1 hypothetical protein N7459_002587 [Penicillium hispanicum]
MASVHLLIDLARAHLRSVEVKSDSNYGESTHFRFIGTGKNARAKRVRHRNVAATRRNFESLAPSRKNGNNAALAPAGLMQRIPDEADRLRLLRSGWITALRNARSISALIVFVEAT